MKPGGQLWLTANRKLAYEATLKAHFQSVSMIAQGGGYKVIHAVRGA